MIDEEDDCVIGDKLFASHQEICFNVLDNC